MSDSKMTLLTQMLAKAEDSGATPEERDTFLTAVSRMAAKAGIELDMLRAQKAQQEGKKVNAPISITIDIGTKGNRGGGSYAALFLAIAEVYDVSLILSNSGSWVKAFGMESDIQITQKMYDLLFPQMIADCIDFIEQDEWRAEGGTIWNARYSFYEGFRNRIKQRLWSERVVELKRAQRKYKDQGQSTEMVMVSKKREVSKMYWAEAGRLKGWSASTGNSRSGHRQGTAKGEAARLSGSKGSISS